MPKITRLVRQQRRTERFSVHLDGKYAFSVSADVVLAERLVEEKELSEAEVERLKRVAYERDARDKVLAKLARRVHSIDEIRQYLRRKEHAPELIESIIATLVDEWLLDDEKFARTWVEERRRLKSYSSRQLWGELMKKGVSKDLIDQVLGGDQDEERGALARLIERKRRLSAYQDEQKLIGYLVRKGYNFSLVREVLSELDQPD